jgi:integrase/recombinase XerC
MFDFLSTIVYQILLVMLMYPGGIKDISTEAAEWVAESGVVQTQKARRLHFCSLAEHLEAVHGRPATSLYYTDIKRADIETWLDALIEKGEAPSTIQCRLDHIKSWFKKLSLEHQKTSPALAINFDAEDLDPKWLEDDELLRFRSAIRQSGKSHHDRQRNVTIAEGILSTGMRVSEILSVKYSQVDLVNSVLVRVRTKGRKLNSFPINDSFKQWLKDYLITRQDVLAVALPDYHQMSLKDKAVLPLFISIWGGEVRALNDSTLRRIFKKCGEEAGCEVTPHTLRHTAIKIVERRFGPAVAQKFARHKSIQMTMRYSKSSAAEHRAAVELMNFDERLIKEG